MNVRFVALVYYIPVVGCVGGDAIVFLKFVVFEMVMV